MESLLLDINHRTMGFLVKVCKHITCRNINQPMAANNDNSVHPDHSSTEKGLESTITVLLISTNLVTDFHNLIKLLKVGHQHLPAPLRSYQILEVWQDLEQLCISNLSSTNQDELQVLCTQVVNLVCLLAVAMLVLNRALSLENGLTNNLLQPKVLMVALASFLTPNRALKDHIIVMIMETEIIMTEIVILMDQKKKNRMKISSILMSMIKNHKYQKNLMIKYHQKKSLLQQVKIKKNK